MSMYAVKKTTISLDNFFNPYSGMGPPECCYCAPTGVPIQQNTTNVTNITNQQIAAQVEREQLNIQIQVNNEIQALMPGLGSLAFMTKMEDASRTLARGRIEKDIRRLKFSQGTAEMGMGPFNYNQNLDDDGVPVYHL